MLKITVSAIPRTSRKSLVLTLLTSFRAPISGGQYHWVSEFASPGQQKFLSYITGKDNQSIGGGFDISTVIWTLTI